MEKTNKHSGASFIRTSVRHGGVYGLFSLCVCAGMLAMSACSSTGDNKPLSGFDAQSHRGGRGLMPENTIASEKTAIDYNTTLEMDLQMSRDSQVVVSHDAYFNADFCLTPEGETMKKKDGQSRLLFNMRYDSIEKYDVGLKPHPGFPRQKDVAAVRPLLSVLIDSVEAYAKTKNHVNHYNIELKTSPKEDGKHYPDLATYVSRAMQIINDKGIAKRTMMQSFDVRALRMVHDSFPDMETSYLVSGKDSSSVQGYISKLGFTPAVFSPEYHMVTPEMVAGFHKQGVKVIPWTPNTVEEIQQLKDMGVDGVITDYPDLYSQLKN